MKLRRTLSNNGKKNKNGHDYNIDTTDKAIIITIIVIVEKQQICQFIQISLKISLFRTRNYEAVGLTYLALSIISDAITGEKETYII